MSNKTILVLLDYYDEIFKILSFMDEAFLALIYLYIYP